MLFSRVSSILYGILHGCHHKLAIRPETRNLAYGVIDITNCSTYELPIGSIVVPSGGLPL